MFFEKKKFWGKRPDLIFISREKYRYQGNINFEIVIGEVCSSPWWEKEPKTSSDLKKMFKNMKDCRDLISKYFYNKYGNYKCNGYNLRDIEIYGILITGKKCFNVVYTYIHTYTYV